MFYVVILYLLCCDISLAEVYKDQTTNLSHIFSV